MAALPEKKSDFAEFLTAAAGDAEHTFADTCSISPLTFTVTQSEKGIVTRTRTKASMVRSMAQTPGPSGSAVTRAEKNNTDEKRKERGGGGGGAEVASPPPPPS